MYNFLIEKAEKAGIEVTDEEKFYLFTEYANGKEAMERITSLLIEAYGGIENFQGFIQEYNNMIKNNYLNNKEIVSSEENSNKR